MLASCVRIFILHIDEKSRAVFSPLLLIISQQRLYLFFALPTSQFGFSCIELLYYVR